MHFEILKNQKLISKRPLKFHKIKKYTRSSQIKSFRITPPEKRFTIKNKILKFSKTIIKQEKDHQNF